MELTEGQKKGLEIALNRYKNKEKYTVISGWAGTGKAQPIDTIIPTPIGERKLGDIKAGDYVYNRFGNPVKVLSVHPQGIIDSYIVTFEDGRQTKCNNNHLFSYYTSRGNLKTKTIQEMLDMGLKNSGAGTYKFKIPVNNPLIYTKKDFEIDPYVIGAMLGDGCCKQNSLTISSENDEIPKMIGELIDATPCRESELNYNWTFLWNSPQITYSNNREYIQNKPQTINFFKKYQKELCCGAEEKRIPEEYFYGSIEQRFSLLQGLMDTDGSINSNDNNRFNMRYTSINFNLIKDIQKILYSLGYKSTITEDKRTKKYRNRCYSLNILIPNEDKYHFFRLKRKKDIAEKAKKYPKRKDYPKLAIVSIEKEEIQRDMVCIYVDDEEHLYLTNDYIVTHNTTLVKAIVSALADYGINPDIDVVYTSFTGKATQVLIDKGNKNSKTLHKLLYKTFLNPDGSYRRTIINVNYRIVVVDEISMVPKSLIDILFRNNCYVICLGDNFQLPPVNKSEDNHLLDKPHIQLTEIMRQEADSEIIQVTSLIRNGEEIPYFDGKDIKILSKNQLNTGMLNWADQIIVGTNNTRIGINNQMRELNDRSGAPQDGDKVICLKNYWETFSNEENPLVNGTIGYLKNSYSSFVDFPKSLKLTKNRINLVCGDFITDNNDKFKSLCMDENSFSKGDFSLNKQDVYKVTKNARYRSRLPFEFTYGYAITCHKAQGSQYDKVLVIEERFPFDAEEHARWLYTAATRAAKQLVIVR